MRVAPNRSSYLRCSHPLLTWPIVASRLVASLQSKFAAGTAFSLLFSLSYFSFPPLLTLSLPYNALFINFFRLIDWLSVIINPNLKASRNSPNYCVLIHMCIFFFHLSSLPYNIETEHRDAIGDTTDDSILSTCVKKKKEKESPANKDHTDGENGV